ncbi:hypothetical protein ACQP1O_19570 [Nocardia sp. CA-151230]|uniref:hypothetical protein n=1 Tax=Nocardia sp. CA-151230 TaxID=3239982 RepID=UPI003D94E6A9
MTTVETITAELTITGPREIAMYGRTFDMLAELSVTGDAARAASPPLPAGRSHRVMVALDSH